MGFDISNGSNGFVKSEFSHDLIFSDIDGEAKCSTCGKRFSLHEFYKQNRNISREPCPKKVNDQLKINREKEMINMLGKYFCIWKV